MAHEASFVREVRISAAQSYTPAADNPLPAELFGYHVVDRIGEGALSSIYVVSDPATHQLYALKHVIPTDEKHVRFIEQLQNEFNVSKLFRYPGLRKCVDLKLRRRLFGPVTEAALVMEMVDGLPLDKAPLETVPLVVGLMQKAGAAIAALHHLRYLHCDLKPSNIIRLPDGGIKLIDFGQACPVGTIKERVQGTPDYIAPEQVRCRPLDYYTDVYGFGATLYWALTLQKVPTLYTIPKADRHILKEQKFPRPRDLNPAVPEALSELVMDCVRYKPGYRPETMTEVLHRLQPFGEKMGS